jgi:3-hydroxyacyl-[acyl-carrier-protein] dehydratase
MTTEKIIDLLPYSDPFLFVDTLDHIDDGGARGSYTFPEDSFFYQGHFKGYPVTPGVILTETMAQIGVVCLGIHLISDSPITIGATSEPIKIALTSNAVEFYHPVFPGETVVVQSEKVYFRFGKLKCKVEMHNAAGKLVCKGEIAGMMKRNKS